MRSSPRAPFLAALAVQLALFVLPAIPWAFVLRPIPMLVLAVHVARQVSLRRSWPVAIGLALGGAGDVAMFLRRSVGATALLFGIGLFFLGHVGYCVAFLRERAARSGRAVWAAAFVVAALGAASWLMPRLGELALPVGAYAVILTAMTALAALRRSPRRAVVAGAGLFFFSDVLIGARLATPAVPIAVLALILPTYYLGQYLIAAGWVTDALSAEPRDQELAAEPAHG